MICKNLDSWDDILTLWSMLIPWSLFARSLSSWCLAWQSYHGDGIEDVDDGIGGDVNDNGDGYEDYDGDGNDDGEDDDDDDYPANSHHDKNPPWWEFVSNEYGGNMPVTKSHHW